jgi:hypothetical protein
VRALQSFSEAGSNCLKRCRKNFAGSCLTFFACLTFLRKERGAGLSRPERERVALSCKVRGVRHRSQRSQGPTCSLLAPIGSWSTFVEDVSRRRADLAAGSAQTTGPAPCRTVRAGGPPREVGAARRPRKARCWSSCCRRLSCVASLTDEWSTETEHNIALGNQVKPRASIAGKAPPAEAKAASRAPATFRDRVA